MCVCVCWLTLGAPFIRLSISLRLARSARGSWQVPQACVCVPAVGAESRLRRKRADLLAPVGAVEQVAVEALPGLPLVVLDHRHGAVRLRAAGVHTVLPGVHPVWGQQESGPLLDGGLGLDDAVPDAAEVVHTRVGDPAELV